MQDIAAAYETYGFIGHEFLTWLWFQMDRNRELIQNITPDPSELDIGNRLVLENQTTDNPENITIKGDDANLSEGMLALNKGAVVKEMNLVYRCAGQDWRFTLKGEALTFSNLKVPDTGSVETRDDIEGYVMEKAYLYEKAFQMVDSLFQHFIHERLSNAWTDRVVPDMRRWLAETPLKETT
jgi:hypothetical protein